VTALPSTCCTFDVAKARAGYWYFPFLGVLDLPEALITGREDIFLTHFFRTWSSNPQMLSEKEIEVYLTAYREPGAVRGFCADYRAGGEDLAQDEEDAHIRIDGRRAANLSSPEEAEAYIGGYVAVNDVSERAWQLGRPGQWLKGKSFATSNPAGPYLVTPDEVPMVGTLKMTLSVNGARMQEGMTADIVFGPSHLIWYLSQFLVLEPGDLIDTGTPAGIGRKKDPRRYLVPGHLVELEIAGLSAHRSLVQASA